MRDLSLKNLSKEFRTSYQVSELLYNSIVSLYNFSLDNDLFNTQIKLRSKKKVKELCEIDHDELLTWLQKNKRFNDHFWVVYNSNIKALIYDFISHISEVLQNILKGNLVIAYSLIRKPFKETLTTFELLLSNPREYYINFINDKKTLIDPKHLSKEIKLKIIYDCLNKIKLTIPFDEKMIYELRFDRFKFFSYDKFCNKAIHLITSAKGIETESLNLNLIFSNEDDKYDQYCQIFMTLPIILYYSYYMIFNLIKFSKNSIKEDIFEDRRIFGMLLWAFDAHMDEKTKNRVLKKLTSVDPKKDFKCPNCEYYMKINRRFLLNFSIYWIIKCQKCKYIIDLSNGYKYPKHWQ